MKSNVFSISGNSYDVDNTIDTIVQKTKSDTIIRIDSEVSNKSEVSEELLTPDIFLSLKVVLVRGYPNSTGKDQNYVLDLIPRIPDSNIVIFYTYGSFSKSKKFYEYTKKNCKFREFGESRTVPQILSEIFEKNKKIADESDVNRIAEYIGNDADNVLPEAMKLINYVGKKRKITFEDAKEVCCFNNEFVIWEIISSLGARKEKRALDLLSSAFENECEPEFILNMVHRSVRLSLMLKDLKMKGKKIEEIIKDIKEFTREDKKDKEKRIAVYGDYEIKKAYNQSNSFYNSMSLEELLACLRNVTNSMLKVRSVHKERDKQTAMVMLIFALCSPSKLSIEFGRE
jgi:DNA polymerase III delta subunit